MLLATIPLAYVADVLTLWQIYVVVFLTGVCTVFFDVAYQRTSPLSSSEIRSSRATPSSW